MDLKNIDFKNINFEDIKAKLLAIDKKTLIKVGIAVGVTDGLTEKFDAVKFVKVGSEIIGGQGGGGRKDFAQAGGQDQSKIDEAFEKLKTLI